MELGYSLIPVYSCNTGTNGKCRSPILEDDDENELSTHDSFAANTHHCGRIR